MLKTKKNQTKWNDDVCALSPRVSFSASFFVYIHSPFVYRRVERGSSSARAKRRRRRRLASPTPWGVPRIKSIFWQSREQYSLRHREWEERPVERAIERPNDSPALLLISRNVHKLHTGFRDSPSLRGNDDDNDDDYPAIKTRVNSRRAGPGRVTHWNLERDLKQFLNNTSTHETRVYVTNKCTMSRGCRMIFWPPAVIVLRPVPPRTEAN